VNALSERLEATVERDGKIYRQEFERGVPRGDMQVVGDSNETGTTTTFLADGEIFEETDYDATTLLSRFREVAFLTRGLRISFTDERADGGKPIERNRIKNHENIVIGLLFDVLARDGRSVKNHGLECRAVRRLQLTDQLIELHKGLLSLP
jgi:DNA gyrase/topoisomerase IV subunit B